MSNINEKEKYQVTFLAIIVSVIITIIAMIVVKLWKYWWFRYPFIFFVCMIIFNIYRYNATWDSFAPEQNNVENFDIQYTRNGIIFTNNSKTDWLESTNVECMRKYKNGDDATIISAEIFLTGNRRSWLPPGGKVIVNVNSINDFYLIKNASNGIYDDMPKYCRITHARSYTVLNHKEYNATYTITDKNAVEVKLYNPHPNKIITGLDASCFDGKEHKLVTFKPNMAPYTKPQTYDTYENRFFLSSKKFISCQTIRIMVWDQNK